MEQMQPPYVAPVIKDYGDVWQITASAHPVLGSVAQGDLSFSSPAYPKAPGSGVGPGISTPHAGHGLAGQNVGGSVTGSNPAGAATPNSGTAGAAHGASGSGAANGSASGGSSPGGGGTGGGGGTLPFTGLAVGALAAIGSGFAGAGAALRRAMTSRGRR